MENLFIKATHQTPEIHFQTDGNFLIKGISTPDLVQKHYKAVFAWLDVFKQNLPSEINLVLEIDYLNTSSSIIFIDLLILLNSFKSDTRKVNIVWRYEEGDEDIVELGEHLGASAKIDMQFSEML